jgi:RNA polymerase sigma factor for flagellar operon FliA
MYLNNMTPTEFAGGDAETRTTRDATILQYIGPIHTLAKRLQFRVPPCVTLDDLVGAGTIGLIQAVDRFQPSRGLQFGTYAKHRIWGAMLDFLRGEDPLSRTERRRIRKAETASVAGERPLPATISLEQLPARELRAACAQAVCPESLFPDRAALKQARQGLSPRENRLISLLYELDWKNRDVARELGVNESRVSQIKHVALTKLRTRLQERTSRAAARLLRGE